VTLSLSYSYPDGSAFDVKAHNENIIHVQKSLNAGGIDPAMMSSFEIKRHMIMPDQAVLTRGDFALESTALYGDAFGLPNSRISDTSTYRVVAGAGIRWYQPYDVTVGILQWSFFMAHNSWAIRESSLASFRDTSVQDEIYIRTAAVFDGKFISNSHRQHSINCQWPACSKLGVATSKPGEFFEVGLYHKPYRRHVETEAHSAKQYHQHLMLCPGLSYTDTEFGIKKGWHELTINIFMTRPSDYVAEARYAYFKYSKSLRRHKMMLNAKADFGVRGARVVTFL